MARIAVYGASGYTGRLVAGALAAAGARPGARRPRARRACARRRPPARRSRSRRSTTRRALARALDGCAAVVGCAGPFLDHGAPVLEAAIEAGVPYADTAAEQAWVHRVFERYGPLAAGAGWRSCRPPASTSCPATWPARSPRDGLGPLRSLDVAYAVDGFRLSGGTVRSALAGMRRRRHEALAAGLALRGRRSCSPIAAATRGPSSASRPRRRRARGRRRCSRSTTRRATRRTESGSTSATCRPGSARRRGARCRAASSRCGRTTTCSSARTGTRSRRPAGSRKRRT